MSAAPYPAFSFAYAFACVECGQCCRFPGNVLLGDADITRLAAALDLSVDAFIASHTRLASNRRQLSLQDTEDGSCVLLEGDACSVYEARPDQCRRFPFPTTTCAECPGLQVGVRWQTFSGSQPFPGLI